MKKFILLFMFLIFIGCYDSESEDIIYTEECGKLEFLCTYNSVNKYYRICDKGYSSYFKVNNNIYYTAEYLLLKECGIEK